MIKLTKTDGTTIWVHPGSVCSIEAGAEGKGSRLCIEALGWTDVNDSPAAVVKAVEASL